MIVHASLVPHPPLLIPHIGKDNLERLDDTAKAYKKLAAEIKESEAETILIISPHGIVHEAVFNINQRPDYTANFEDFGDFATKKTWYGNTKLSQLIKSNLSDQGKLRLYSEDSLDHGTAVPLLLLTEGLIDIRIIPLTYSGLGLDEHFELGEQIAPTIKDYPEKIAIIASGDLSHCLTKEAPGGYSKSGAKFDNKLIELLKNKKTPDILGLKPELIEDAQECGLKSIMILLGILSKINYEPEVLSYEYPFGVGYLTMNFKIN